jgi:phage shock protein C
MNISEELKKLHELHQSGALTDAEFERAKSKVLDNQVEVGVSGSIFNSSFQEKKSEEGIFQLNQLRRSKSDQWLGGVCGGIAKSTGLESWIWRVIFIFFVLVYGVGFLAYIIAWIFIPEED